MYPCGIRHPPSQPGCLPGATTATRYHLIHKPLQGRVEARPNVRATLLKPLARRASSTLSRWLSEAIPPESDVKSDVSVRNHLGVRLMIPCRETTRESLLSVGFATLNATAKFGCIPAGYVILPRSHVVFRHPYSYTIPSDSQAVVGASEARPNVRATL